jgi:4,5-dihydroxyphthalate decarboxylase
MSKLKLTLACWDYDRTRPLIDGRVQAEGIDLEIKVMRPREIFPRMLENGEFEVSELSLGSYVSLKGRGICPFVAVPVALSKIFRHSLFTYGPMRVSGRLGICGGNGWELLNSVRPPRSS